MENICHWCGKKLERNFEKYFIHCFECCLKKLEKLTSDYDPCPACRKKKVMKK